MDMWISWRQPECGYMQIGLLWKALNGMERTQCIVDKCGELGILIVVVLDMHEISVCMLACCFLLIWVVWTTRKRCPVMVVVQCCIGQY